jgi:glyoxylate/hydroxypyruvate reductase A
MEKVPITPHLASITVAESAARDVAESNRQVLRGEPPLHAVEAARGLWTFPVPAESWDP